MIVPVGGKADDAVPVFIVVEIIVEGTKGEFASQGNVFPETMIKADVHRYAPSGNTNTKI